MNTEDNFNDSVIKVVDNLPSMGFEAFFRSFLKQLGFSNVNLCIIENGDAIKGEGVIEIGVLSQNFVFFVLRNKPMPTISSIIKIRALMNARTDKALLISTGEFTREIKKESKRKNQIPIDLINKSGLIDRIKDKKFDLFNKGERF